MILFIQETIDKLTWAGEFAPLLVCLSVLFWILAVRLRFIQRPFVQPFILLLFLGGMGYLILGSAFVWVVLCMLLGLGFAMHTLAFDLVASIMIRLEHRVIVNSWIDGKGFSGRVQALGWRGVELCDRWGRFIIVPNRFLVQQSFTISNPGDYRTEIQCWISPNQTLLEAEKKILHWVYDAPWISKLYGIYPSTANERIIVVEVSLLRAEDENKVLRALRTIVEQS
ncbi:MAG: hypothetical protein CL916_08620 [Deltaproteobacteria bacterium]|nr:hypothetical protein [Deltaproteobacteria bacterium]